MTLSLIFGGIILLIMSILGFLEFFPSVQVMAYLALTLSILGLVMLVLGLLRSKRRVRMKTLALGIIFIFLAQGYATITACVFSAHGNLFSKYNLVDFEVNGKKYCYDTQWIIRPHPLGHVGSYAWLNITMWWNASYPIAIGIASRKAVENASAEGELKTLVMSEFKNDVQNISCMIYEYDEYVFVIQPAGDYHNDVALIIIDGHITAYSRYILVGFIGTVVGELTILFVLIDSLRKIGKHKEEGKHLN